MTAFLFNLQSGRWTKGDFRHLIHFNHVVRQVTYNDNTDDFSVVVKSLVEDKDLPVQKFDYLIVATGHFSVPNVPFFPGIEEFPGRVMHSHDFRNAYQFQGQWSAPAIPLRISLCKTSNMAPRRSFAPTRPGQWASSGPLRSLRDHL